MAAGHEPTASGQPDPVPRVAQLSEAGERRLMPGLEISDDDAGDVTTFSERVGAAPDQRRSPVDQGGDAERRDQHAHGW